MDVQLWVGKKGLEAQGLLSLSVHMMENRNPYPAPGLFNIPNKILTIMGLCMGQFWVNSLGISVSLLILIFLS